MTVWQLAGLLIFLTACYMCASWSIDNWHTAKFLGVSEQAQIRATGWAIFWAAAALFFFLIAIAVA